MDGGVVSLYRFLHTSQIVQRIPQNFKKDLGKLIFSYFRKFSQLIPIAFLIFSFCGREERRGNGAKQYQQLNESVARSVEKVIFNSAPIVFTIFNYYPLILVTFAHWQNVGESCVEPSLESFYKVITQQVFEKPPFQDNDGDFIPDFETDLKLSKCSLPFPVSFAVSGIFTVSDGNISKNFLFSEDEWGGFFIKAKGEFLFSSTDGANVKISFSGKSISYSNGNMEINFSGDGQAIDFSGIGEFSVEKFNLSLYFQNNTQSKSKDSDCYEADNIVFPTDTGTWKVENVEIEIKWKGKVFRVSGSGEYEQGCIPGGSSPTKGEVNLSDGFGNTITFKFSDGKAFSYFNGKRIR